MIFDRERASAGWRKRAACRGLDPRMWHPLESEPVNEEAVWICWNACPVRVECLADAMKHNEPRGIWGGLTARERTRIRRSALKQGRSRPGDAA